MNSIEMTDIDKFVNKCNECISRNKKRKRELHERLSIILEQEVRNGFVSTFGKSEHVQYWQKKTVGSKGGYAAIRPQKGGGGKNAPGAITNYIENGYRKRKPNGQLNKRRYHTVTQAEKVKNGEVPGRFVYDNTRKRLERSGAVKSEVMKFVKEIEKDFK